MEAQYNGHFSHKTVTTLVHIAAEAVDFLSFYNMAIVIFGINSFIHTLGARSSLVADISIDYTSNCCILK